MDILNITTDGRVQNITFGNITLSKKAELEDGIHESTMTSTTEALVFTLSFMLAFIGVQQMRKSKQQCNIPGPWALPIFGNMLQFGPVPFLTMTKLRKRYGDVFLAKMGSQTMVVLNGYQTITQAFVHQTKDFAGRSLSNVMKVACEGHSIAFSDYDERWRVHKRFFTTVLHKYGNDGNFLYPVIAESAQQMRDAFLSYDGKPFDPYSLSVNSLCSALNAMSFRGKDNSKAYDQNKRKTAELLIRLQTAGPKTFLTDALPWAKRFMPDVENEMRNILLSYNEISGSMIKEYKNDNPNKNLLHGFVEESEKLGEREARCGVTPDMLVRSVGDVIGAGSDTTAHTIHWLCKYLAHYTSVQSKMHDEIVKEVGKDQVMTNENSAKLTYTRAVILEVMRHSSVLPMSIPHKTTKDTIFQGYFIPKDTIVVANLHSISRDENIFPDPEVFNPDRFILSTPEGHIRLNTPLERQLLMFSAGLRRCPGERLGKKLLLSMAVTLIQGCKLSPAPGETYNFTDCTFAISYKSNQYKIIAEKR